MSTHDDLRDIALNEFASAGYGGTSLQRIAELAGLSKSSVLYHYSSKEALLEAAIGPAIDRMMEILDLIEGQPLTGPARVAFIEQFVDFLLQYRLEVHTFINQGPSLEDVPVVDRANSLVFRLGNFFKSTAATVEDQLRFGIALGGAAYVLSAPHDETVPEPPVDETRAALISIVSELLAPVSLRSAS
ncbi:MAG TPA: TetR/AcrR family transcriptional regulator [Galbitalea sp.]|jgi:AcrR family transcriptional regulator